MKSSGFHLQKNSGQQVYTTLACGALLVVGLSALGGGLFLLLDPSGSMIGMPVSLLEDSPFQNYFIPGLILFSVLGAGSVFAAWLIKRNLNRYAGLVIVQGMALLIWVTTQVFMIGPLHIMQFVMFIVGLILLTLGWKVRA